MKSLIRETSNESELVDIQHAGLNTAGPRFQLGHSSLQLISVNKDWKCWHEMSKRRAYLVSIVV